MSQMMGKLYGIGRIGIIAVFMLVLSASPVLAQFFTIDRYHSTISIYDDSSLFIKETIEVKFDRPRHGIYREIPYKYRDDLGRSIVTPIEVLHVQDDKGNAWKYRIQRQDPIINIRIGDPERYVGGNRTYVILYKVKNAVLFFDDHDELYWNVTGNEWKAPIRNASADVFLMTTKEKTGTLSAVGYEGYYGSKEECGYEAYNKGSKFYARRHLKVGEGLTIAMKWDKGLVTPPSRWAIFFWTLNPKENFVFLFPFISLLFMTGRWYRQGRDPVVRESVRVMYEPPKHGERPLTPAEVGTLIDEKINPRDITSSIVNLAIKGYLSIEEIKKEGLIFDKSDYRLKKNNKTGDLTLFEAELMECLFPGTGRAERTDVLVSGMENKFYTNLSKLKKLLYEELVRKRYFVVNPEKVRMSYIIAGVLAMVGVTALLAVATPSIGKSIAAGILTGLPVLAFAGFMPVKTRHGASAYMDILGFQEFLNRAEKDRLERMEDKALFSKFLPYAIALDVSDNWAKAFDGIYQEEPDWYVSRAGHGTFSAREFTHSINTATSSLASAMSSAPRGSGGGFSGGGGGGGFSGGGGGGGGGGSW